MGLSQQIGASSLIKPGVINSAAQRPASPYEGQVIFQKDTDQMLVWNGTAWVVPNAPAQNPTGLELITPTSVTGGTVGATGTVTIGNLVSSVTVNGAFSSLYNSYEIIYNNGVSSNLCDLRISSPQSTGSNYFSQGLQQTSGSATLTGLGYGGLTYWVVGVIGTTSHGLKMTIHNPFLSRNTYFSAQLPGDYSIYTSGGVNNTANSLTAFTLTPQVGTLTGGQITVYGYRN